MSAGELPEDLLRWVEEVTQGGRVTFAKRHHAGASREAWRIDVSKGDDGERASVRPLFLLKDKGGGGGSLRDAAVLRALAPTSIPVPEVVATCDTPTMLLLERLPGRSDFPPLDREEEREPTARHLMELTAALHALETRELSIDHLTRPKEPEDCARLSLEQARGAWKALGERADPFFDFALGWLEQNIPSEERRISLVHSDMGPGNFLFENGRVTGIVDWEVAHFGDPMEDLAAIAVRDMATPMGNLAARFREYEVASGVAVDLARVHYFRALVLVRNSLMIGLGLAHPAEGFDVVEMTMYQTLLMRAAALVLCDNLGVSRPGVSDSVPEELGDESAIRGGETSREAFLWAMGREIEGAIAPGDLTESTARALGSVGRGLAMLEHEARVGALLDGRERADRAKLAEQVDDPSRKAAYFARKMHRLAERHRPLMGDLQDRLPQLLEKP